MSWRVIARTDRDRLGEGPVWCEREQALYWVDILRPAVHRYVPSTLSLQTWPMPEPIGWLAPREGAGFVAGFMSGFALVSFDPLRIEPIGNPEPHLPNNRMNDGKADTDGRIWCGTMDFDCQGDAVSLYCLSPDLTWRVADSGYGITNGPAFSRCGSWLYHTDTRRGIIYRFRRDDGGIAEREPFITFAEGEGWPDGMTVDADDGLWVAHYGGGRITRFLPSGAVDQVIALPALQPTSVAFGGPKLDQLFVTSATDGLPPSPYDGALFEVDTGRTGIATGRFAG